MSAKKNKTRKDKAVKSAAKEKERVDISISDKELQKIQKELKNSMGKSMLIEQDIKRLKDRLYTDKPLKAGSTIFQKEFLFKCGKCVGEFKHTAKVAVIHHTVVCPKCKKEHLLQIKPHAGNYKVKLPKSIRIVK
jgi:hypothetical protein